MFPAYRARRDSHYHLPCSEAKAVFSELSVWKIASDAGSTSSLEELSLSFIALQLGNFLLFQS